MSQSLIHVQNLSVVYRNGHVAIQDISFKLDSGRICGLVGANGAGKSTLYKALMGFVTPAQGHVLLKGSPVKQALKNNIVSYVPQTEDVDWNFPVLVKDVVMMGRFGHMGWIRWSRAEDKKAVNEALERVEMEKYQDRQIGELSGGQKKRVFLARALAQKSPIILLDEPFTGVDFNTEKNIISLLKELRDDGKLIMVSTHNLGSVPDYCDEVMLINRILVAKGPVSTTYTKDNLEKTFGPMLRHLTMEGGELHADEDPRGMTVITDDERPLVLYGRSEDQKIVKGGRKGKNSED